MKLQARISFLWKYENRPRCAGSPKDFLGSEEGKIYFAELNAILIAIKTI